MNNGGWWVGSLAVTHAAHPTAQKPGKGTKKKKKMKGVNIVFHFYFLKMQ
jgi:hypothetical protein